MVGGAEMAPPDLPKTLYNYCITCMVGDAEMASPDLPIHCEIKNIYVLMKMEFYRR